MSNTTSSNTIGNLHEDALLLVAKRFKALSEPTRLRLIAALMNGEKAVSDLVEETGGLQANVSKHLLVLFDAGILSRRKQGLHSYYSIADETVYALCELACGSVKERLAAGLEGFPTPRSA